MGGEPLLTGNGVGHRHVEMFSMRSADALRNVYLCLQLLVDEMRGRWSKKYLSTIIQRSIWFDEQRSQSMKITWCSWSTERTRSLKGEAKPVRSTDGKVSETLSGDSNGVGGSVNPVRKDATVAVNSHIKVAVSAITRWTEIWLDISAVRKAARLYFQVRFT